MLTVYKASAGSGKTFRLVLEVLKILLIRPDNYRHVLAVTFTNKATAEMKERILDQLGKFAGGLKSPYLNVLREESNLTEEQIRHNAQVILEKLLFDFDRFTVCTIDKFNQRILKAFNREIGINPGYQVETDTQLLISEAVDRIIDKVDQNPGLFSWLKSFIREKIRNGKSFAIEADIKNLGSELFKEKLQNHLDGLTGFLKSNNNDRHYLEMLFAAISSFEKRLKEQAAELVKIYSASGYKVEDFSYGTNGVAGFLEKSANGKWNETLGERVLKAAESAENWVTRKNRQAAEMISFVEENMRSGLVQLLAFINEESPEYFTARVIAREWFSAALLVDLNEEIAAISREKGILPLANSNLLLKGIIDGSETPFIFEKAGNIWNYYLLDEFQDTSEMQWANFKPLISNSLSDQYPSLVVGDVKQSIYRWRNSNWNLLHEQIYRDFPHSSVVDVPLDSNFRSGRNIVVFNNNFFRLFSHSLTGYPKISAAMSWHQQIEAIYSDVIQKPQAFSEPEGFVCIEQLGDGGKDFEMASLERLVEQIKALYRKGFRPGELAILVRKKEQGAMIVRYFLEIAGLPENQSVPLRILSGESLFLKTSAAVVFIVYLLRCMLDSRDRLSKAIVLHLYRNYLDPAAMKKREASSGRIEEWFPFREWEQEFEEVIRPLLESIEKKSVTSALDELVVKISEESGLFKIGSEMPYLLALIDQAAELTGNNINDIPGFLEWWEEKGKEVSVKINENPDAIRLLTIHSAKGLEFKAVLIPFTDWEISGPSNSDILWCVPPGPPFNKAPLVPVRFTDQLSKTIFAEDYFRETAHQLIDNINLVYVAFTRAAKVLWVNVPSKNTSGEIGHFICQTISELKNQQEFEQAWDEQERKFSFGTIPELTGTTESPAGMGMPEWIFNDFSGKMALRSSSDDFLQKTQSGKTKKNLGKMLHAILSEILTTEDVLPVCKKAMASGILLPEEWEDTLNQLQPMIKHPLAEDWFSGKWKVLTETDLLSPDMTLRPDRIMLKDNKAVIVDYKTGDVKPGSHVRQVERYKQMLRETGIAEVRGYLWYLQGNELVEV